MAVLSSKYLLSTKLELCAMLLCDVKFYIALYCTTLDYTALYYTKQHPLATVLCCGAPDALAVVSQRHRL